MKKIWPPGHIYYIHTYIHNHMADLLAKTGAKLDTKVYQNRSVEFN